MYIGLKICTRVPRTNIATVVSGQEREVILGLKIKVKTLFLMAVLLEQEAQEVMPSKTVS